MKISVSDLMGNDALKEQLTTMIAQDRLPHAILLTGPEGCGKRTLAGILSAAFVCASGQDRPCGVCRHCAKARAEIHPDISVLAAPARGKAIGIDAVRALRGSVAVLPNEAGRRVCRLDNAQDLTVQAQNALLKMLEEPPAHVVFVLTATEKALLLPTILSRCTIFALSPLDGETVRAFLARRFPEAAPDELDRAVGRSGGILGRAMEQLSPGAAAGAALAEKIARAMLQPVELPLLRLTAPLEKDRVLTRAVLSELTLILRDALARKAGSDRLLSSAPAAADALSASLSADRLVELLSRVRELLSALTSNMNQALLATLLSSELRR